MYSLTHRHSDFHPDQKNAQDQMLQGLCIDFRLAILPYAEMFISHMHELTSVVYGAYQTLAMMMEPCSPQSVSPGALYYGVEVMIYLSGLGIL
jgi:hypothetical protein